LIDEDKSCFKDEITDRIFLPFEADQVKQIPLHPLAEPDHLSWKETKYGIYNVKTTMM